MPLMTWADSMSVGVKMLDDDHKKLVGLVNELHDGILEGRRAEVLGPVLDNLVKYTAAHFKHEEDLFDRTKYPAAAAHKKEHNELIIKAKELQSRYRSGATSMLSLETMSFLKNWLAHHIGGCDKDYSPHMKAHGVH